MDKPSMQRHDFGAGVTNGQRSIRAYPVVSHIHHM